MLEISVAEIMKMLRRLGVRLRVFDSEAQSSGPEPISSTFNSRKHDVMPNLSCAHRMHRCWQVRVFARESSSLDWMWNKSYSRSLPKVDIDFFLFQHNTKSRRIPSACPVREYVCNCAEFCMRGGPTESKSVSKSGFHRHWNPVTPMQISRTARHCDHLPSLGCNNPSHLPSWLSQLLHFYTTYLSTLRRSHSPIVGPQNNQTSAKSQTRRT